VSIWIRKRQAEKKEEKLLREHSARRRRPALEALSLPQDLSENSMRLILMGSGRALVENCLSVVEISQTQVRLNTRAGVMTFQGTGLLLADVRPGAMSVTGQIESVHLPHKMQEGADRNA